MPEHLRSLIVILLLAGGVFAASAPAVRALSLGPDYGRRLWLWFGFTLIAFVIGNFWFYALAVGMWLLLQQSREPNKIALFLFLLFVIPPVPAQITGLGIINYFFVIDQIRLLELVILLPLFLKLRQQSDCLRFGRTLPDKALIGFLILSQFLYFGSTTFTNALRLGFYLFIDVFLPYYVVSRSLRNTRDFRDAALALVLASLVLAAVGVFELVRHWLLYTPLVAAFELPWGLGRYLEREGSLRAMASTGQSIILGYVLAVALGFHLYLRESIPGVSARWLLGAALLLAGLVASVSRGPWVGAATLFVIFVVTGPAPSKQLAKFVLAVAIAIPPVLASPVGDKLIEYLPFVGSVGEATVSYRQVLLGNALHIIQENPFFGVPDALNRPEMEAMREGGGGIIDLVNTWVIVALGTGLVGLSLFVGTFAAIMLGIFKGMRLLPDQSSEIHVLGRSLLASMIGIQVMIFTVSNISFVPVIYWSVAGMGLAYMQLVKGRPGAQLP